MSNSVSIVVLAAGEGTRLKCSETKPLVPLLGQRLIDFPLSCVENFADQNKLSFITNIVTGFERESVEKHVAELLTNKQLQYNFAFQKKRLGTADALKAYLDSFKRANDYDYTVVICADTPLITKEELQKLYDFIKGKSLDAVLASFDAKDPNGYGRIVRSQSGFHIVEQKDASESIQKISEVNSGLYIFNTKFLIENIDKVGSVNKAGEFYLTDLFQDDYKVDAVLFENAEVFLGVNDLEQLAQAEKVLRHRKNNSLREQGVRFIDSDTTFIDWQVSVGNGTTIFPNSHIYGESSIGERVVIESGSVLKNAIVADGVTIFANSYLEAVTIGKDCKIGPSARLRPGTVIGEKCKIGNFVEIKKAKLASGVKISHLSYVGDAEIGENTNIGCGFITCNYDGINKHKTVIGKNSFIGSDCQAVAPIKIGDSCLVAAGTTITQNMENGDLAIARMRQQNKKGLAKKFLK